MKHFMFQFNSIQKYRKKSILIQIMITRVPTIDQSDMDFVYGEEAVKQTH